MKLELYYFDSCPFCQLVLRGIEQLQINAHVTLKNIMEDAQHTEYLIEKTGRRTVPCLFIDGEPMFESQDILNWLRANQQKILGD